MQKSEKSYATSVCLSSVFGVLGIHHFYLGRFFHGALDFTMTAIALYLICMTTDFTLNILGVILLFIDIIHTLTVTVMLLIGSYKDGKGHIVAYPGQIL